jgi:hypothetical protein
LASVHALGLVLVRGLPGDGVPASLLPHVNAGGSISIAIVLAAAFLARQPGATSLVVLLSIGCQLQSSDAQSPAGDPVAEIRALEAADNAAIFHGDVAAVEKMTSDDHTFITPRAMLLARAQMLKGIANGSFGNELSGSR